MNVCFFGGRLVRDFEKRECADGSKVLTNSLAIKKSQDKTTFIDIAIFTTKLCEIAEKYLKKGDYCVYECELTYSDKLPRGNAGPYIDPDRPERRRQIIVAGASILFGQYHSQVSTCQ